MKQPPCYFRVVLRATRDRRIITHQARKWHLKSVMIPLRNLSELIIRNLAVRPVAVFNKEGASRQ